MWKDKHLWRSQQRSDVETAKEKKEASIALKWKTFGRSRGSSNSFKLRNLTKLGQDMAKTEQLLLSYCQRSCAGGRKGLVVPGLVPKTAAQMWKGLDLELDFILISTNQKVFFINITIILKSDPSITKCGKKKKREKGLKPPSFTVIEPRCLT